MKPEGVVERLKDMGDSGLRLSRQGADPAADSYFKDKTLLPGQGHGRMGHDHAIVTLVLHGRLEEGFATQTQSCSCWQLHYKPPGAVHTTDTGPEGARMFLLGLRPEVLADLGLPVGDQPRTFGSGIPAAQALAMFQDLATDRRRTWVDAGALEGLLRDLGNASPATPHHRPSWISELYERVGSETTDPSSLEQLSREFSVHPVYLARAFRRHFRSSIGALRRRTRVERAIDRLTRGSRRLADLALDLGYADQSHFSREFKKLTGWSPARFRRTTRSLGCLATPIGRLR